jgi:hypothetical protein
MLGAPHCFRVYRFNEHSRSFRLLAALAVFLLMTLTAKAASKPSAEELATISERGRTLAEYDSAAWHATDAVVGARSNVEPAGRYIAHKTLAGWVVDFGRLNVTGDKFLVAYEATQTSSPAVFEVKAFNPVREDGGWNLTAAKGIEAAVRDFGRTDRPYNIAVLPAENDSVYVYLYPARAKAGIYPFGADVRYRVSPGAKITEKRHLHRGVIEYRAPAATSEKAAAGYHTHVLTDLPEDTDVMLVLTRQPSVPEFVGAGIYVFAIDVDGKITVEDDRPKP